MRGKTTIALALTIILLSLPAATAQWSGRGFTEPDTARDRDGNGVYMWPGVPTAADGNRQVYFNIYSAQFIVGGNPNSGIVGGHVMPYPTSIHAFLGVWTDCNGDGFIGMTDGALLEYRAELLLNSEKCPAVTYDPTAENFVPAHNDGEWVQEFLWLGPDNANRCADDTLPNGNTDPYTLVDDCSRVWGDFGEPEDGGTASCPLNPRPRGTYQSTGGFLRYADCIPGWKITDAVNTVAHASGLDFLAFDDAEQERPDESASPLNQKNPYGQEGDASFVSVWDCTSPGEDVYDPTAPSQGETGALRTIGVKDPTETPELDEFENGDGYLGESFNVTGPDGRVATFHGVVIPTVNPSGSPAGTVNQTLEGSPNAGSNWVINDPLDVGVTGTLDWDPDCDRTNGGVGENSDLYDLEEADFEATTAKRTQTDFYLNFQEGSRASEEERALLGEGTSADYGEGLLREFLATPMWYGDPGYAGSRNPYINRDDLSPWGVVKVTGYAYVAPDASAALGLSLPGGAAVSKYGDPHCLGTTEITGAWQCDATKWWQGPDTVNGGTKSIQTVWQVAVGQDFQLRDVDCWDTTVAGSPSAPGTIAGRSCVR